MKEYIKFSASWGATAITLALAFIWEYQWAQNLLLFLCWTGNALCTLMIINFLATQKTPEKSKDFPFMKRPQVLNTLGAYGSAIEAFILASFGWFWTASFLFFTHCTAYSAIANRQKKLQDMEKLKPKETNQEADTST